MKPDHLQGSPASKRNMATEVQVQEPAAFGEVFVSVIEEREFPLNPHLLALSGNNMQHYCTMLSLQEFPNIRPEMVLQTEHGEMPLSLVTVVEEFEAEPWLCEGSEPAPFDLLQQGCPGPQVQIQYDFVLSSEGGILQGDPSGRLTVSKPEQGTNLQISENESVASGENRTMSFKTQEARPTEGDSNAALEGFGQPSEMAFTAGQENTGAASELNNPQNVSRLNLNLGTDLRTMEHCSSNSNGESVNEQPYFVVQERSPPGERLGPCPNCGLSLNGRPVSHQLSHTGEKSYQCPCCRHLSSGNTTSLAEHPPLSLHDDWERLFRLLNLSGQPDMKKGVLKKRFHCPECGRGFVHKSSVPRHQKLHRKDNPSENPGQEKSHGPAGNQLGTPKTPAGKKPPSGPEGQSCPTTQRSEGYTALCDVCGQGFSAASRFHRHLATHSEERPFCCCHCGKGFAIKSVLARHLLLHQPEKPFLCQYCNKSYIQKSHLIRHCQKHHQTDE